MIWKVLASILAPYSPHSIFTSDFCFFRNLVVGEFCVQGATMAKTGCRFPSSNLHKDHISICRLRSCTGIFTEFDSPVQQVTTATEVQRVDRLHQPFSI